MSFRSLVLGAAVVLSVGTSGAQAATITFQNGTYGNYDPGSPVTEDGFDYSVQSGQLFHNVLGNPGSDLEGSVVGGGGVLQIVRTDGGLFTFSALDYAAFSIRVGGSQILTLHGWRDGLELATDSFTLANTMVFSPTFDNWTTFGAVNLAGLNLDRLSIDLDAAVLPGTDRADFAQAVDNVVLGESLAVPEPATWAMLIAGFGLSGVALRRRRSAVLA